MATIDDLAVVSITRMSPDALLDHIKQLRSQRRDLSAVKKSRLSKNPPKRKVPSLEELAADMSPEALERMIKSLEERIK